MIRRVALAALFTLMVTAVGTLAAQDYSATAETIAAPDGQPIDLDSSIILFYSDNCPHCHNQLRWMAQVQSDFPDVTFRRFEIEASNSRANQRYFSDVMAAYASSPVGWPRTVVGDRLFIGFAPREGGLVFDDRYQAWVGYQNQLYDAIAELQARLD